MGRWHVILSFTKRAARHAGNFLTMLKHGNREFTGKIVQEYLIFHKRCLRKHHY